MDPTTYQHGSPDQLPIDVADLGPVFVNGACLGLDELDVAIIGSERVHNKGLGGCLLLFHGSTFCSFLCLLSLLGLLLLDLVELFLR